MRIVVAPQEYKGTLPAREAADAISQGVKRVFPGAIVESVPLSDGGPGLIDAMLTASPGQTIATLAKDPLGRPIEAQWCLLEDASAVIESAAAAGLSLVPHGERDPRGASTFGVGQLMLAALNEGCKRIVVGLGGSATNDGGAGMATALGARFLDAAGKPIRPGGASLAGLERIDISGVDPRLGQSTFVAAADVTNPLCGPQGASLVYGPQKGASPEVARELDAALRRYAMIVERDVGVPVLDHPGAGAAGGLGAGLIAFAQAEVRPGFEVLAELLGLPERIREADLLVTGEGRLDRQTSYGKAVARVARMAAEAEVPVLIVPGALGPGWETILPHVYGVEPIVGGMATAEEAMARPAAMLSLAAERAIKGWLRQMQ